MLVASQLNTASSQSSTIGTATVEANDMFHPLVCVFFLIVSAQGSFPVIHTLSNAVGIISC